MNRNRFAAAAVALVAALVAAPTASAQSNPPGGPFGDGAPGYGDDYFPFAGNGGYDVQRYDLELQYDYRTQVLDGSARISAKATENLRRFNLDLRGFDISGLKVNGQDAQFAREGVHELQITPRTPLVRNRSFTVHVDYSGVPQTVVDPDGSSEGWVKTSDGAFVVNEPQGSPGWFPVNDDPNDKARFDYTITVPAGKTALANGVLLGSATRNGWTTWRWHQRQPISPYLTTATNGDFALTVDRLSDGTPIYNAIAPGLNGNNLARQKEIHDLFIDLYGPYPFEATGAVIDRGGVGYALETATKANYDGSPAQSTVVHEIAHEWFGNAVTLSRWRDIWLNEGFARWSEWIWTEKTGGASAAQTFRTNYNSRTDAYWTQPPADLGGPADMFDDPAYRRGAMTLQALRERIGEADFMAFVKAWFRENRYSNASTQDLIATAERISGEQLDQFFQDWLFDRDKPPAPAPLP
jgi:aminopeptidase N